MTVEPTIEPTIDGLRFTLGTARRAYQRVGFVPTMGALHDGHLSLIRAARAGADLVVTSIFVNPLQFGPSEDLSAYPRPFDRDVEMAGAAGADVVFAPAVEEMYPTWPLATTVSVAGVSEPMEGERRPGHFDGVATVVAKLLSIVGPCRAFFGEKDWQQLAVVRRMVADLSLHAEIVGCPTVREADGLAMSSRNVYLTPEERAAAPVLHRALTDAKARIEAGERSGDAIRSLLHTTINPVASLAYGEVVDAHTLQRVEPLSGQLRILVAARFGRANLIDNVAATSPTRSAPEPHRRIAPK
jgi:pantoate--beta-alanine ligase